MRGVPQGPVTGPRVFSVHARDACGLYESSRRPTLLMTCLPSCSTSWRRDDVTAPLSWFRTERNQLTVPNLEDETMWTEGLCLWASLPHTHEDMQLSALRCCLIRGRVASSGSPPYTEVDSALTGLCVCRQHVPPVAWSCELCFVPDVRCQHINVVL